MFKSPAWRPIALLVSVGNVAAAGYAAGMMEPWHAAVHGGLAAAFWLWAQRLGLGPRRIEQPAGMEELEAQLTELRRELGETQERLDFAERVLARPPESHRVNREQ